MENNKKIKLESSAKTVEKFLMLEKIGQGTFGTVYRAEDKETGEIVAIKECSLTEQNDLHMTSFREISTLKMMHHPNIVDLREVVFQNDQAKKEKNRTFLVLEYIDHDLGGLIDRNVKFSISEIKQLMVQLLSAVQHIHENWIVHRDLKLSNILYSRFGLLKVTDFGLARKIGKPWDHENHPLTTNVQTLWYRAPELLLGALNYSFSIDIFSIGCIFGELLLGVPILPGSSEIDQLVKISRLLGSPDDKIWPGFSKLKYAEKIAYMSPQGRLAETFSTLSKDGLDLLSNLLGWDPSKRPTAAEALRHPYFKQSPLPQSPNLMPSFPNQSIRRN